MTTNEAVLSLFLEDERSTDRLGEDLALALRAGDCLALSGDLGTGKSSLARALLRAMADDEELEVPSPTFTLVQSYDLRIPVSHFDLYRLGDPGELTELGFDEALQNGICLVEWPEMAEGDLPVDRINLRLDHEGKGRRVTISAPKAQTARIRRVLAIRDFLGKAGFPEARRRFLTGDASLRAYEAIYPDGARRILMDWPPLPEGPPVLDGKPYPKVAHLAENAYPFVAIADTLREAGFATPEIYDVDYDQGILLIEDLGSDGVLDDDGKPIAERYRASVECLALLHSLKIPQDIPLAGGHVHHVPDFDRTAMKMEVRLVLDWHLPWKRNGAAASDGERADYLDIWDKLIDELATAETNLLLRDFHSPNIIWRASEAGIKRVGLIDFQDAMIGPTSYDLASITQDARVTIGPRLFQQLMDDYLSLRRAQGNFDEARFMKSWAIMSAQRNCKLAGLWVRLMQRDGKPGYMKHMPRTLSYLEVALQHETLAPLRDWCVRTGIVASES